MIIRDTPYFCHFRVLDDLGDWPGGLVTVCMIRQSDEVLVRFGSSWCSPLDRFSRPRGRGLANERARAENPLYVETERRDEPVVRTMARAAAALAKIHRVPWAGRMMADYITHPIKRPAGWRPKEEK